MKNNVLVTWGGGYIGSILVPKLLEEGFNVTVIDNFIYDQISLNHLCHNVNFKIINGDVRDESLIKSVITTQEYIIPLAALVGAPICKKKPKDAQSINCDSIFMLLKHMPTTNSSYGRGGKNNFCDENSPLNPISKYAIDKVVVEKELMRRENSISFRLATVFGMSPRMRIDLLVNDFTYRALNDGTLILFEGNFKRNYIHVQDLQKAFVHGINNFDKMVIDISGKNLSIKNIDGPVGVNGRNSDNSLIKEKLYWAPSRPLREGMVKLFDWVKEQI